MKRIISVLLMVMVFCSAVFSQNWDIRTLRKINSNDNNFACKFSKGVSNTIYPFGFGVPVAIGIASLVKKDHRLMSDAIFIGTTVLEAVALTTVAKELVGRERPFERYPDIVAREDISSRSFPSGHTATAFALATSLSIRYPKWYVIAPSMLWAGAVGYSRMQMGVHYPTDVIGGMFVGVGTAFVNVYVNRWLNRLIFPENRKRKFLVY